MTQQLQYLDRPGGRIAYTVTGTGPLVVAVPGMGDLRSAYDDLAPALVAAGYRVAVTDLRGHGDSDTTFPAYGDVETGWDVLALVEHLGGPAVLVGNSMGAAASAWAAAERPDAVRGLVLLGPFLREPEASGTRRAMNRLLYRAALAGGWGAGFWARFYRSLNAGRTSPRLDAHVAEIRAALRRPGHLAALRNLALQLDHDPVTARLGDVDTPTLALLGAVDPDYPDPAAEADWIRSVMRARVELVDECGHYPQHQRPDVVVPAVLDHLAALPSARA
ncbi:alpha/beta fold hydrolase [Beutenbergia cavernae]|nr:alpha/beta hydrolase [Beutenbergia cavernae]